MSCVTQTWEARSLDKLIILDYWCPFGEKAIRSLYIDGVIKIETSRRSTRMRIINSLHTADLNAVCTYELHVDRRFLFSHYEDKDYIYVKLYGRSNNLVSVMKVQR